jgi:hypothetical protein
MDVATMSVIVNMCSNFVCSNFTVLSDFARATHWALWNLGNGRSFGFEKSQVEMLLDFLLFFVVVVIEVILGERSVDRDKLRGVGDALSSLSLSATLLANTILAKVTHSTLHASTAWTLLVTGHVRLLA